MFVLGEANQVRYGFLFLSETKKARAVRHGLSALVWVTCLVSLLPTPSLLPGNEDSVVCAGNL